MKAVKQLISHLVVYAVFAVTLNNFCFAELPFGTLKANTAIHELVPFDVAQKIAIKIAKKKGQIAMGPALPAVDDDGDIVAYMFPFVIGAQSFPTQSRILSQVQYGRKIAEKGFCACDDVDKAKVRNAIKNKKKKVDGVPGAPPNLPDHSQQDKLDKAYLDSEARKLGQLKMIGAGQYGTIVVSARYDRFPVPLYMDYLAPYFYQGDLAIAAAKKSLNAESVTHERVYFLENRRAQYLEFSSSQGDVLINAYSLESEPKDKVLIRIGEKLIPDPAMFSQITYEWTKIKQDL